MSFDPEKPFPELNSSDLSTIVIFFDVESSHMAVANYSKKKNICNYRQAAARLIKQYGDSYSRDSVIPYLALNYFDNFVSTHLLPRTSTQPESVIYATLKGRKDNLPLFTTCCFISASKMRKIDFSTSDFLMKQNLNFKMEDIVEIETEIDRLLDSRQCKRPVTALCFLDYFIGVLTEVDEDQVICLKSFATHKLFALQYDIRYTEFKPSIMAAAALVWSSNTFYEDELGYFINTFLDCEFVNQESLKRAIEMLIPDITVLISSESPNSVEGSPSSSPNTTEPIPPPPQNLDSAAAEADNTTTEASVKPNVAPKLELQGSVASSHGSSSSTAKPMLPPAVPPPYKNPVTAMPMLTPAVPPPYRSSHGSSSSTAKPMLPPAVPPPYKNPVTAMPMLTPAVPPPYRNSVTAMPMLPPPVFRRPKSPVTTADQETTDKSSMDRKRKKPAD